MGICVPPPATHPAPRALPPQGAVLFPDLSEWNGRCSAYSEAVIRVYEAGLDRADSRAGCLAANLAAKHIWWATYGFQRPGNCNYQADRTVAITRAVGHVVGPIVDDAEVHLNPGEVRCFLSRVEHDGYKAAEYTCPGCGVEQVGPRIWIAAYPYRPAGSWIAHQFSSEFNCRGIVGDCSVNEGMLSITQAKAKPAKHLTPAERAKLIARRETLRYVLLHYGCRKRKAEHHALGPKCARWFREGNQIARELA